MTPEPLSRQSKRAAFLDGCGSLTLAEIREWARELTPHPAICHDQTVPDDMPMVVAGMFAASPWRWAELLLERDDVAGRQVLERMVAYYAEHDRATSLPRSSA